MKVNLILSARGQVTLPASMRKRLGLQGDAVLTAEEQGGRIILTPAIVMEWDAYSDAQIAAWDAADAFGDGERMALESKLAAR